MATIRTSDSKSIYDLKYPGAAIDAILDTAYDLQNVGYIFRGLASEYSNTPTERSWVLAGEGETGHGFTSPIPKGYIGVCVFDGTSWTGKLLKCVSIDSTPTPGSTNAVSSGGAYAALNQLATGVAEALDNMTFTDVTPAADQYTQLKLKLATTDSGIERIITYLTFLSATTSKAGLLSAADKAKLDAILTNLRSLEIDDTTAYADLGTKIVESIKATIGGTEETISTFQILAATASKAGLMSAEDKGKLDGMYGYIGKFQRTFVHEAQTGTDDLTKYDVYTFKPNSVYRLRPSYEEVPAHTTEQWNIALVAYLNGEDTVIFRLQKEEGTEVGDLYFITPAAFDYIRVGLRGTPFYSVEIEEVTVSDNMFSFAHTSAVTNPATYPVKDAGKYKITVQVPYSGTMPANDTSACMTVGYYTSWNTFVPITYINRIKAINNVVYIDIPSTAIAVAMVPTYDGDAVYNIKVDKVYYSDTDVWSEENILPLYSRLDDNAVIHVTPSENFWGAFHAAVITKEDGYISIAKPSVRRGDWPGIRTNFVPDTDRKIRIKFRYKSAVSLRLFLASDIQYIVPASAEWNFYEVTADVTESFDRIQISAVFSATWTSFDVRDVLVSYVDAGSHEANESVIPIAKEQAGIAYASVLAQVNTPYEVMNNKVVKTDGTINQSITGWKILVFRVNGGASYLFCGKMSESNDSYFINWFDKNGDFLSHDHRAVLNTENTYLDELISAPADAAYLYINCLAEYRSYYQLKGMTDSDGQLVSMVQSRFRGKRISILGDSISTASDNNAVQFTVLASDIEESRTLQAYPTYYDVGTIIGGVEVTADMIGVLSSFTPVEGDEGKVIGKPLNYNQLKQDRLWWKIMADSIGAEVLQNVSWSGSSVSSHEGNNDLYKTSYAWHDAQIAKLSTRDADGNTIKPDVVIVYRGVNDLSHSPYSKLTDFGADATSMPADDTVDGGKGYKEAYAILIQKIRTAYPEAEVICCTLQVFRRNRYSTFPAWPMRNNANTLAEFNDAIREVADMMGCRVIEFDKDGITWQNCYPTYISDSSSEPTHPNANGHEKMAQKAIIDILT